MGQPTTAVTASTPRSKSPACAPCAMHATSCAAPTTRTTIIGENPSVVAADAATRVIGTLAVRKPTWSGRRGPSPRRPTPPTRPRQPHAPHRRRCRPHRPPCAPLPRRSPGTPARRSNPVSHSLARARSRRLGRPRSRRPVPLRALPAPPVPRHFQARPTSSRPRRRATAPPRRPRSPPPATRHRHGHCLASAVHASLILFSFCVCATFGARRSVDDCEATDTGRNEPINGGRGRCAAARYAGGPVPSWPSAVGGSAASAPGAAGGAGGGAAEAGPSRASDGDWGWRARPGG